MPLLAAGLGLVLASTVLVVWGFTRAADRAEVLMITADVEAGTPIPPSAVATTSIGVDDGVGQFYPAGTDLSGAVAAVDLSPGDVLSAGHAEGGAHGSRRLAGGRCGDSSRPLPVDHLGGRQIVAVSMEAAGEVSVVVVAADTAEDGALSTVIAAPAAEATQVAQWSASETLALVRVP